MKKNGLDREEACELVDQVQDDIRFQLQTNDDEKSALDIATELIRIRLNLPSKYLKYFLN